MPIIDPNREEFGHKRTVCGCSECVHNCEWMPSYLVPSDLDRMKTMLKGGESFHNWAREHLLASPGATVVRNGKQFKVPTIVPAYAEDGHSCHWLKDGGCTIHDISPFGCAFFDHSSIGSELVHRSIDAIFKDFVTGGEYSLLWAHLWNCGHRRTDAVFLRQRMKIEWQKKLEMINRAKETQTEADPEVHQGEFRDP